MWDTSSSEWDVECTGCRKAVDKTNYQTKDGAAFCDTCAEKRKKGARQRPANPQHMMSTSAGPCDVCGERLSTTFVKAGNKRMHKDCLKCSHCNKALSGGKHTTKNNKLCCSECANKITTSQNVGFIPSGPAAVSAYSTPGIRVSHKDGSVTHAAPRPAE